VRLAAWAALLALAGCASIPREGPAPAPSAPAATPAPAPAKGAYYKDDGPGANPPPDLAAIPDAVPKAEPLHRFANRPYQVFGKDYVPLANVAPNAAPFRQAGIGSWYGRRFHGAPTSSGEPYDMYAMTAAHPTLPIPSYARVTNLANGRSVVVRINDRGPFHADRIIDLSYTAAWKLGYADAGSARVEVESLMPGRAEPVQEAKTEVKADGKGIFLQLGAFSARESAENFRARVYRELAWLSEAIHVVAGGALFRLQLGPYRTQDDARAIADRIQSELSLRPLIVGR
jgi:rare lipoprotein A